MARKRSKTPKLRIVGANAQGMMKGRAKGSTKIPPFKKHPGIKGRGRKGFKESRNY